MNFKVNMKLHLKHIFSQCNVFASKTGYSVRIFILFLLEIDWTVKSGPLSKRMKIKFSMYHDVQSCFSKLQSQLSKPKRANQEMCLIQTKVPCKLDFTGYSRHLK